MTTAVITTGDARPVRKVKRKIATSGAGSASSEAMGERKRSRESPLFSSDRATTMANSRSVSNENIFLEDDDDDSDEFSDDVVQPTKRHRTGKSLSVKRPSPRRTRTLEGVRSSAYSYSLSSPHPRPPSSFAYARFLPTPATIPTLDEDEERPIRTRSSENVGSVCCEAHNEFLRASSKMASTKQLCQEGTT